MIIGEAGDTSGKWFRIDGGPRMRFHGRWPTAEEYDVYMCASYSARVAQAKPTEPQVATFDIGRLYPSIRASVTPCITGVEVDGDESTMTVARAVSLAPFQEPLIDFAGWLFRDATEYCAE